jgi:hypothetical protein
VSIDEPGELPAATLVAYAGEDFPAGTVIGAKEYATVHVSSEDQAGAVRWIRDRGLVHQIFVGAKWRRRHLGTLLLYVASAFHQANGWPGKLYGDGRRTEMGESFVSTLGHQHRIAPLSEVMPPMDPARD